MSVPRYMLRLAYRGTAYAGWQRQPNAHSVEEVIDTALSTVLGEPTKLVGCGRTDAGVHASAYAAHFEFMGTLPPRLLGRLNRYLPEDIALYALYQIPQDVHARFSAQRRSYRYDLSQRKDPFRPDIIAWLPQLTGLDRNAMQAAAALLLDYTEFAPFCKTNSDAYTMRCALQRSEWEFGERTWHYHVTADRFLRGMVRLIVGMCLEVGRGRLELDGVRQALAQQRALPRPYSVPAAGLYLTEVNYPNVDSWKLMG